MHDSDGPDRGPRRFTTTQWSVILAAGEADSRAAQQALSELFEKYWYPLYAYARRRGHLHENAQDLTQSFFLRLLEKGCLKAADPERGKFRSFLLSSFKNFLVNQWELSTAQKRGGGSLTFSLEGAEDRFGTDPREVTEPERSFDREWALALVRQALDDLQREMISTGAEARFSVLSTYLTGEVPCKSYREAGEELGLSEAAVKVAVHRMRRRLGILLRNEIAQTVRDPALIEGEIRYLMEALSW